MGDRKLATGDVVVLRVGHGYRIERIADVHPGTAETEDGAEIGRRRPVLVAVASPLPEVRS
jgi:hypothetical protein